LCTRSFAPQQESTTSRPSIVLRRRVVVAFIALAVWSSTSGGPTTTATRLPRTFYCRTSTVLKNAGLHRRKQEEALWSKVCCGANSSRLFASEARSSSDDFQNLHAFIQYVSCTV